MISGCHKNWNDHKMVHMRQQGLTEATFCCDMCGKAFYNRDNLNSHKKNMHRPPVPTDCPICKVTFPKKSAMKLHYQREHNPHKCQHCDYIAPRADQLELHMIKHRDPTFKCSFCGKMLKTKKTLIAHERGHTGEAPYKCDVCGNAFKSSGVLLVHKQGVHKIFGPNSKKDENWVRQRSERSYGKS